MKKLVLLLIMALCAFTMSFAQASKTGTISTGNSYVDFTFASTDVINGTTTTYSVIVKAPQDYASIQNVYLKLDSVSTPRATVQLQGQLFDSNAYVNIGSAVSWHGNHRDTSIYISNATANYYRNYKVLVTRTLGTARINDVQFKQWFVTNK